MTYYWVVLPILFYFVINYKHHHHLTKQLNWTQFHPT